MGRNLVEGDAGALALAEDLPQHFAVAIGDLRRLERLAVTGRLQPRQAGLDLARPVGIDQATGGGRAAHDNDQDEGDDAQDRAADAATAALGARRGWRGGNVLNGGVRVVLHIKIRRKIRADWFQLPV